MIDLRHLFGAVRDQRGVECCLAIALADAIGSYAGMSERSAMFIHYNARKLVGHENHNVAVRPEQALAAVARFGVCCESIWPNLHADYRQRPPPEAFAAAQPAAFETIRPERAALLESLAAARPVVICLRIFPSNNLSFRATGNAPNGVITPPEPGEDAVRNHAVLLVGYDHRSDHFILRNSFGADWGQDGYGFLPSTYLFGANCTCGCWRVATGS
jgi:hypothetical protein